VNTSVGVNVKPVEDAGKTLARGAESVARDAGRVLNPMNWGKKKRR
jgi:hypothetical protein